jgi:hypothetical protein
MGDDDLGETLNAWLGPLRALRKEHQAELDTLASADERANRLAELNVFRSLEVVRANKTVQQAMTERGLTIHGVIYDIPAGELRELRQHQPAPALLAEASAVPEYAPAEQLHDVPEDQPAPVQAPVSEHREPQLEQMAPTLSAYAPALQV